MNKGAANLYVILCFYCFLSSITKNSFHPFSGVQQQEDVLCITDVRPVKHHNVMSIDPFKLKDPQFDMN